MLQLPFCLMNGAAKKLCPVVGPEKKNIFFFVHIIAFIWITMSAEGVFVWFCFVLWNFALLFILLW